MTLRRCFGVLGLLLTSALAGAEELSLPDGSRWQLTGTTLNRTEPAPALAVTMNVFAIGIDCTAGLKGNTTVTEPAYLPSTLFYSKVFEQPDEGDGDAYATVCADLPGATLVANAAWQGALAASDAASIRLLLEYLAQEMSTNVPAPLSSLPLFDPAVVSVPLDAHTGVWNFVRDRTTADVATLVQLWPKATMLMQLQRSTDPQACATVGFDAATARPSWAPTRFFSLGGHRDGAGFACYDDRDGRLLMVSVTEAHMTPDAAQRVGALLDAITTAMDKAPKILIAPKVSSASAASR